MEEKDSDGEDVKQVLGENEGGTGRGQRLGACHRKGDPL